MMIKNSLYSFVLIGILLMGGATWAQESTTSANELMRQKALELLEQGQSGRRAKPLDREGFYKYFAEPVKYIRGQGGVPFPEPTLAFSDAFIRERLKSLFAKQIPKATQQKFTPLDLPRCQQSNRNVTNYPLPSKKEQTLYFDMLFISAKDLPPDPDEVFGPSCVVHPLISNEYTAASFFAEEMNITCLPTRIRAFGHQWVKEEGLPALMNYSKNPTSEGTLHVLMEKYRESFR